MRARSILPPAAHRLVDDVGAVDIVVGIPSYNNARTIGHVVEATHAGLAKYFPRSISTVTEWHARDPVGEHLGERCPTRPHLAQMRAEGYPGWSEPAPSRPPPSRVSRR